jgi:hypothetical protein
MTAHWLTGLNIDPVQRLLVLALSISVIPFEMNGGSLSTH